MNQMTYEQTMKAFPRLKARTLRFSSGAPRSARVVGDGSRTLFLRSDGPEDLVTSLWMHTLTADGRGVETLIADPRVLLADAGDEEVPAEERARRERAREGGRGIVSFDVDADGDRVVFVVGGTLFLARLGGAGTGAGVSADAGSDGVRGVSDAVAPVVERLAPDSPVSDSLSAAPRNAEHPEWLPILNPRISPDGRHVVYTTGRALVMVDVGAGAGADAGIGAKDGRVRIIASAYEEPTSRIGLAEFVAGEEMDRYEGFWWSPESDGLLFETFDAGDEPTWYLSDPANPETPAQARRYPRALTHNARVALHHAGFDFGSDGRTAGVEVRDVAWDVRDVEYLAAVSWTRGHDPVILVQNRRQTRDQVLRVELDGGASDKATETDISGTALKTTVLEEHRNEQWLDIVLGTPCMTPDGRLVCARNDMEHDTNRLTVDGTAFTPIGWQVRQVLGVDDDAVLAVVQRTPEIAVGLPQAWRGVANSDGVEVSDGAAVSDGLVDSHDATASHGTVVSGTMAVSHDARSHDVMRIDYEGRITPLIAEPGVWTASEAGRGVVLSGRTMHDARSRMIHRWVPEGADGVEAGIDNAEDGTVACGRTKAVQAAIANHAAVPGFTPRTSFVRLGKHRIYTAITRPGADSPYAGAKQLPVLLKPYGGPGFQQVALSQAFFWESQWWADQGFLVVTADGRGTTGRGPVWDREIFERMKDVTLADQVEIVHALADAVPEANLDKVAMIGWSYGGFLSALAVLEAPDVVHAACAGAPPTDWTLYDTHYTERYLGLDPKVYARNSIVSDAPKLRRPLMLIHGFADDNVTIANSLRLSQALMAAGREHTYLPLTGITHMTNDETVAENLLLLQRDFLYRALDMTPLDTRAPGKSMLGVGTLQDKVRDKPLQGVGGASNGSTPCA